MKISSHSLSMIQPIKKLRMVIIFSLMFSAHICCLQCFYTFPPIVNVPLKIRSVLIHFSFVIQGLLQGCIAGPVNNFNRRKGKREHNAHLFAVESPLRDENEQEDFDYSEPISEDQWTTDAKKAKLELEVYEDVDQMTCISDFCFFLKKENPQDYYTDRSL